MAKLIITFNRWDGGVGLTRHVDGAPPGMTKGGNCDTSQPGQITLPLAVNTATQAGAPTQAGRIFAIGEIGGGLFALSKVATGGSNYFGWWGWDGATATWTLNNSGGVVTDIGKGYGVVAGTAYAGAVGTAGGSFGKWYTSTNGTWGGANNTDVNTCMDWFSNMGTSATVYWLGRNGTVYSGTTTTAVVAASLVPTGETVKAFFSWKDSGGNDVLYVLTDKHLRQSNTTPNAFTIVLSAGGSPFQCAFVIGNHLFIGHGTRGGIREYAWDANKGLVNYDIGLDAYDGQESDRLGPETALFYAGGWLFAATSGDAAGLATSVHKRRLTTGAGWHSVYKASTANQSASVFYVSDANDSVARLHIAQKASATTDTLYYLNYPLDNPVNNSSATFGNAVTHDFPEVVLAQGETYARVTKASLLADSLSANETVGLSLSYDGGSMVAEGTFDSNVNRIRVGWLDGVQCQRVQARITLNRAAGTATNTPKVKTLSLEVDDSVPAMTPLAESGPVG